MRDLERDLEFVQASTLKPHEMWPGGQWGYFIREALEGWPEAIRRAMEVEAQIQDLQKGLDRLCEITERETERTRKLEAVAEAAQTFINEWNNSEGVGMSTLSALDELEKALAALEEDWAE